MATVVLQRNFPYLQEHFIAAVLKSSVIVKSFVCAVITGYLLSFISVLIPYMTVTPGYVLPPNFMIQAYAMHCFIEFHFWEVIADIIVIAIGGKLLEPIWGAMEMLVFFLILNTGVALIVCMFYVVLYYSTKNDAYLFSTHIHGLAGFIAGFTVAVKQVMPDYVLLTTPLLKLRNAHMPLLMLLVIVLLRVIKLVDGPYLPMYTVGIVLSWIYLRFYQRHGSGNRGDMAEGFSFPSFFPGPLQPPLTVISNFVFNVLVKIHVCSKPRRRYDVSSSSTITLTLPGTDVQDAERHRQLALKALNERLSKSVEVPVQWPSMDDKSPTSPTEMPGQASFQQQTSAEAKDQAGDTAPR